jgi:adenine-specific DNA-methyltransferase
MDYFIHKNLGGYLRDELDYYLQNQILETNELVETDAEREPTSIRRARVVRQIADRIIEFLDQIESFQQRLFEKPKFVTQTDYMVTLDKVPNNLYDEILDNEEQLEQWRDVYNTDEWEGNLSWQGDFTEDVLHDEPHLMIDTALFSDSFNYELLSEFDNLSKEINGTLVHGENYQALNILSRTLRNQIKCIYIDPPYNTGNDDFIYKDNYQHSSWLSLMSDRLAQAKGILREDGVLFSSIDDRELHRLTSLMNNIFGERNHIANFIWKRRTSSAMRNEPISPDHEYALLYSKSRESSLLYGLPPEPDDYPYEDEQGQYASTDLTVGMDKHQRPDQFYEITNPRTGETYEANPERVWRFEQDTMEEKIEQDLIIWPDEQDGNMTRPRYKTYYDPEELKPKPVSTWIEEASTDNELIKDVESEFVTSLLQTHRNEQGGRELRNILPNIQTYYPKPVSLIKSFLQASTRAGDTVLDFFAGSGTTAHAVMELNKQDEVERDYVLVEVGEYFETVLRPRIQKLAYTLNWEDGCPQGRDGQSHMVKYHRIESYEDALNNVVLEEPTDEEQQTFAQNQREEYVSGYMLDFESEGASLMEPASFEQPFDHELDIERNGVGRESVAVDLVETFHYLLGADVHQFETYEHQNRQYVVTECSVERENSVDSVLTVWRNARDLDLEEEREWVADELEREQFDQMYINSESAVSGAEPVEVTFKTRMEAANDGAE